MFEWGTGLNTEQRIRKNVINLISMRKAEVPFDRTLGITSDYIDKPLMEATSEVITDIIDTIEEREPRAQLTIEEIEQLAATGNQELEVHVSV